MPTTTLKPEGQPSSHSRLIWRIVQIMIWLIGISIFICLILSPETGLHLFWDILIPVAPLMIVVAIGVWRNICPMATNSLFARYTGFSKRIKMTTRQSSILNLIAIIALFIIVPFRHALFNMNGHATAILIFSLGIIAIVTGFFFEWKSAWCSGLCPVHPVEKLYGLNNRLSIANAHCDLCHRCVTPCPDSTPGIHPLSLKKTNVQKISGLLMTGGFAGFVWGWFQVPDYPQFIGWDQLISIYIPPFLGLVISSALFLLLSKFFKQKVLITVFAAVAVSCYYWFRLPALFGYGLFPGNGMLVDLTAILPEWSITILTVGLTGFFFWWIVFTRQKKVPSWVLRPAYAKRGRK